MHLIKKERDDFNEIIPFFFTLLTSCFAYIFPCAFLRRGSRHSNKDKGKERYNSVRALYFHRDYNYHFVGREDFKLSIVLLEEEIKCYDI